MPSILNTLSCSRIASPCHLLLANPPTIIILSIIRSCVFRIFINLYYINLHIVSCPSRQGMNAVDIRIEIPLDYLALSIPVPAQSVNLHSLQKSSVLYSPPTAINCRTYPLLAVDSPCCPVLKVGEIRKQVAYLYHFVGLHKFSKNYPLHSMLNSLLCSWQCHCMMVLSVGQIFE